ncbi:MAG: glycoside hydrolase family 125 protein [Actinobacteria bacterium]|nr:glycoside hydrolase family 125 protein [Actinomycetota bacterium]
MQRPSTSGINVPPAVTDLCITVESTAGGARGQRVRRAITRLFSDAMVRTSPTTIAVITGDIPAMWLRDSAWQLRPLLALAHDHEVYEILASVSRQQAEYVLIDPYANAFNLEPNGNCWHRDFEDQSPWVFERKYELDSLTCFLDFALRLQHASKRTDHLDQRFAQAAELAVEVIAREQQHDFGSYRFIRENAPPTDHLGRDGYGSPVSYTGMSWSGFRPSDDACTYGYLIPSNAHAAVVLERLSRLPDSDFAGDTLKLRAGKLSQQITAGIADFGTVTLNGRDIWAYEVDGLGNSLLMDDANVPSLLALPYLGWCAKDNPIYLATRRHILSAANPYYFAGSSAAGVGSPHTPDNHVWPIGIAMAALTSTDAGDVERALLLLEHTDAGTGAMHESFNCNDPSTFTRPWFSWADMMYVHLALRSIGASALAD